MICSLTCSPKKTRSLENQFFLLLHISGMDFELVKWLLLYFPDDKGSVFVPFLITPTSECSWSREKYDGLKASRLVTVTMDCEGGTFTGLTDWVEIQFNCS